ncbi:DUF3678 domain-containing protein [Methylocystis heyeri]|uniref:DUF3678 domain-containing protein n=1 Tax=Methylocystis heyeri TaxID=391905 RepID=A0A6B8KM09_9HYPH|nr:DUF3678 domain-containing protein [Methylocystis heyeri]
MFQICSKPCSSSRPTHRRRRRKG